MPKKADWEQFEEDCQEAFGLHSTIASGNQFHDPGDGATGHYAQHEIGIIIDAKTTIHKSYSIKAEDMAEWIDRAELLGKTFILPIRFTRVEGAPDLAVIEMESMLALLELAKKGLNA